MLDCLRLLALLSLAQMPAPLLAGVDDHIKWGYNDTAQWAGRFKTFCAGRKQSPINLDTRVALTAAIPEWDLDVRFEKNEAKVKVKNDGHTVRAAFGSDLTIQMGWGNARKRYTAAQIHWHWGSKDEQGSEHQLDGRPFPMEGHMVFWNSEEFGSIKDAVHKINGLAVLGVFYEKSDADHPLIAKILEQRSQLEVNSEVEISLNFSEFDVQRDLLPKSINDFFQYEGSLTTPHCNENVLWTVFRNPIGVSERQLRMLRDLPSMSGKLADNFRPVQPLNSNSRPGVRRVLYRSFGQGDSFRVSDGGRDFGNMAAAALPSKALLTVGLYLLALAMHSVY